MQSPDPKKSMENSKQPPPAYTYNMDGINVPDSVPHTTTSNAYINCVTDDQLQNGNGDRIENSSVVEVVHLDPKTEDYFNNFPPGYRFVPKDFELIKYYLKRKLDNVPLPPNKMHEANLYKYSPEKISNIYPPTCEKIWYFFTPRDRKYCNGTRPNRAAGTGYWKASGADEQIVDENRLIGFRKALVFYEGKPPGEKLNWLMQEFRVNDPPREKTSADDMRLDDYVLCRIYKNIKRNKNNELQNNSNELQNNSNELQNNNNELQNNNNDELQNNSNELQNNNNELQNNSNELQNNNNELQNNNNELQTALEDSNFSFGYCQEQIPTYSLPQNYAPPTATVATPVSSMPEYSGTADDAAAAIVPDSTASGDIYSSSTQINTGYEWDYNYGLDMDDYSCDIDVNDYLCDDSRPSKRQKKD